MIKRTVWAARDDFILNDKGDLSRDTYLFLTEPSNWEEDSDETSWQGPDGIHRILFDLHDPQRHHYGLKPGQKKRLVVELTIREA